MRHAFGQAQSFTVGIEEELFLVDPASGDLRPDSSLVRKRLGEEFEDRVGEEIFASELELRSRPAQSCDEAIRELASLREVSRRAGATLLGAGLHPAAGTESTWLVETPRADVVRSEMRGLIARTPECALHVHVGMPDAETAVRVHNGLRAWMPLVCALAASSPFWFGHDSGLASARRALTRPYPGRGVPDPLESFDDYEQRLSEVSTGGAPDDYTLLWWDLRLHPQLGTVELREMDAQSRLIDVAAIAALIRGLACHEADNPSRPLPREALEWSMFRAMRDGLRAEILGTERLMSVPEAARAAQDRARPHAREAGDAEALEGIERILEAGSAERQRAAFGRDGIAEVVGMLTEETSLPPNVGVGSR
jgi:carboxylate-amine ligase